jgi:hypothetical protein
MRIGEAMDLVGDMMVSGRSSNPEQLTADEFCALTVFAQKITRSKEPNPFAIYLNWIGVSFDNLAYIMIPKSYALHPNLKKWASEDWIFDCFDVDRIQVGRIDHSLNRNRKHEFFDSFHER